MTSANHRTARIADAIPAQSYDPGLAGRMDELERMFGQLLAIVQSLVESRTEFAGRKGAVR